MTDVRATAQRWTPIFDLIASLAVVASLVYLALEVHQNTQAIQGSAFQELIHASDAALLAVASDSALADLQLRGGDSFDSLSPREQLQYRQLTRLYWRNYENAFLQYRRGLIGDEEWGVYHRIACNARTVSLASTWHLHERALTPSFVELVSNC